MTDPPIDSTQPATRAEWRRWLECNHGRPNGVWLVSYKKATGKPRVEYEDAVAQPSEPYSSPASGQADDIRPKPQARCSRRFSV
jgi:hypothetical protein